MEELAIIERHDYLAVGYANPDGLCHICFESVHGLFRFGVYGASHLIVNHYNELNDLFTVIKYKYSIYAAHTDDKRIYRKDDHALFYGLCATDATPSCGIHFLSDGRVFAGCAPSQSITGCYAYMSSQSEGISYGYFNEAVLVNEATKDDFSRRLVEAEHAFNTLQPSEITTTPDYSVSTEEPAISEDVHDDEADECIAIVTHIDRESRKCTIIYGYKKQATLEEPFEVQVGNILKLRYITEKDGVMTILSSTPMELPTDLSYAKYVEGTIDKKYNQLFAFLKTGSLKCYVAPRLVKLHKLIRGDMARGFIIYGYDKKKESWNWKCLFLRKENPRRNAESRF